MKEHNWGFDPEQSNLVVKAEDLWVNPITGETQSVTSGVIGFKDKRLDNMISSGNSLHEMQMQIITRYKNDGLNVKTTLDKTSYKPATIGEELQAVMDTDWAAVALTGENNDVIEQVITSDGTRHLEVKAYDESRVITAIASFSQKQVDNIILATNKMFSADLISGIKAFPEIKVNETFGLTESVLIIKTNRLAFKMNLMLSDKQGATFISEEIDAKTLFLGTDNKLVQSYKGFSKSLTLADSLYDSAMSPAPG